MTQLERAFLRKLTYQDLIIKQQKEEIAQLIQENALLKEQLRAQRKSIFNRANKQ